MERDKELDKLADRLENERGVPFEAIPPTIYPGMRFTTASALVDSGATRYTQQHIHALIRQGVVPAFRLAGQLVLDAEGVQRLLEREEESLARKLGVGGLRPGQSLSRREAASGSPVASRAESTPAIGG